MASSEIKINMKDVRDVFDIVNVYFGSELKALQWIVTENPLLGNKTPFWMVVKGRKEKLIKFIKNAIEENTLEVSSE